MSNILPVSEVPGVGYLTNQPTLIHIGSATSGTVDLVHVIPSLLGSYVVDARVLDVSGNELLRSKFTTPGKIALQDRSQLLLSLADNDNSLVAFSFYVERGDGSSGCGNVIINGIQLIVPADDVIIFIMSATGSYSVPVMAGLTGPFLVGALGEALVGGTIDAATIDINGSGGDSSFNGLTIDNGDSIDFDVTVTTPPMTITLTK